VIIATRIVVCRHLERVQDIDPRIHQDWDERIEVVIAIQTEEVHAVAAATSPSCQMAA
jgi:hypothetical protein